MTTFKHLNTGSEKLINC